MRGADRFSIRRAFPFSDRYTMRYEHEVDLLPQDKRKSKVMQLDL